MAPAKVNINGTWKDVAEVSANINGTWKNVAEGFTKVNGSWEKFLASDPFAEVDFLNVASYDSNSTIYSRTFSGVSLGSTNPSHNKLLVVANLNTFSGTLNPDFSLTVDGVSSVKIGDSFSASTSRNQGLFFLVDKPASSTVNATISTELYPFQTVVLSFYSILAENVDFYSSRVYTYNRPYLVSHKDGLLLSSIFTENTSQPSYDPSDEFSIVDTNFDARSGEWTSISRVPNIQDNQPIGGSTIDVNFGIANLHTLGTVPKINFQGADYWATRLVGADEPWSLKSFGDKIFLSSKGPNTNVLSVLRLNNSGGVVWEKLVATPSFRDYGAIAFDTSQNSLYVGSHAFWDAAPSGATYHPALYKLNANTGNREWVLRVDDPGGISDISFGLDGFLYASTRTSVMKIDTSGSIIWARDVTGYVVESVSLDNNSNVYVYFIEYVPGLGENAYIAKYSSAGTKIWTRKFEDPNDFKRFTSASLTAHEDGQATLVNASPMYLHITKYNSSGSQVSQKNISCSPTSAPRSVISSGNDTYVLVKRYVDGDAYALFKINDQNDIVWQREITTSSVLGSRYEAIDLDENEDLLLSLGEICLNIKSDGSFVEDFVIQGLLVSIRPSSFDVVSLSSSQLPTSSFSSHTMSSRSLYSEIDNNLDISDPATSYQRLTIGLGSFDE